MEKMFNRATSLVFVFVVLVLASVFSTQAIEFGNTAQAASLSTDATIVCNLSADSYVIPTGGNVTISWETSGFTSVIVNGQTVSDTGSLTVTGQLVNTVYTLTATNDTGDSCTQSVEVVCVTPPVPTCTLTPLTQSVLTGNSGTLDWTSTNADTVSITNIGNVSLNGSTSTGALTADQSYTLTATGAGGTVSCVADVVVTATPVPTCDLFTATPGTIGVGGTSVLSWETSNSNQVFINNGIGSVAAVGTTSVTLLADITYLLTVTGADDVVVTCQTSVVVVEDPVPVCEYFTASPATLPFGGGDSLLDWSVSNAVDVDISPTVGSVGLIGSSTVSVTDSTSYTLLATDDNGDTVSCVADVVVSPQAALSCSDNVTFTASDNPIVPGNASLLSWSTTDVDTVSINVIDTTSLVGSQSVSPIVDTTYTLTATRGEESVSCPLTITTSGGGGGGGSASPRCDLIISETEISLGDTITLDWDTANAYEVTLSDDEGDVIFTTDDYLASEKDEYFDGSITLQPSKNTEYTLLAERGSKDRECKVSVSMDSVIVLQSRDQLPLVTSISLTEVPYTGFEAGTFMTVLFYVLLIGWSLYITYILVVRNKLVTAGVPENTEVVMGSMGQDTIKKAEEARPDVFVASVTSAPAPINLPVETKTVPTVGYDNHVEKDVEDNKITDTEVTELENHAHAQKTLLSSDAVRHLVSTTTNKSERNTALDAVITEAKKTYPLEDGWLVINESRMSNLCEACQVQTSASTSAPYIPTVVPEGSGSLAEAIVTGNVVAAYQMIGNRPMLALADAAADFDSVYRLRQGGEAKASNLLVEETKGLSDEQIRNIITALTGAVDGTYADEASAVKMAIMKAIKEVA